MGHCIKLPPEVTIGEARSEIIERIPLYQLYILKVLQAIMMFTQSVLGATALLVYNADPSEAFEQDRNMINPIF